MNLSINFSAAKGNKGPFPFELVVGISLLKLKQNSFSIFDREQRIPQNLLYVTQTIALTIRFWNNDIRIKELHTLKMASLPFFFFSIHLLHFFRLFFQSLFLGEFSYHKKITFEPSLACLWNRTVWIEVYGKPKKLKILKLKLKWLIRRGLEDDTKPLILVVWLR